MAASSLSKKKNVFHILSTFAFLLLGMHCVHAERTLRQAHIITRHGQRSPIKGYPTDDITVNQWPQGWGQLTEKGVLQHYRLGQWLRERYVVQHKLLNETYNRSQIWIRSSAFDRTVMSAQSCLAGLFPLDKGKGVLNMTWQPIPVWTQKKETDFMMTSYHCDCPRLQELLAERRRIQDQSQYLKDNKEFLKFLRTSTGIPENSTFETYSRVADAIVMEVKDGREVNEWARNKTVQDKLLELLDKGHELMFWDISHEETRFISGLILKEVNSSFGDIVTNAKHHQAHIFSGHDTTISPILASLGSEHFAHNPRVASCILLELYEEENGKFTVEMNYHNGSNEATLYAYHMKNCSDIACPLDEFRELVKDMIPDDIKKDCSTITPGSSPLGKLIVTLIVISCVVLVVIVLICLVRGAKGRGRLFKQKSRFEPINFQLLGNPGSDSEGDADVFDSTKVQ